MDWLPELLERYARNTGIQTTPERIAQTVEYFMQQGYDEFLSIACDAMKYDRKTREILAGTVDAEQEKGVC